MTFDDELFTLISHLWPCTSVRSFSRALGRSSGYWSSLKSQNLPLSAKALMNLSSLLEQRMINEQHLSTKQQMRAIQSKINCELVRRFIAQVEADDGVLEELRKITVSNQSASSTSSLPMPFIMTTY